MKCKGCGDHHIVIINHTTALCRNCVDNTQGGGEFGDFDDELALESLSLELLETGEMDPDPWDMDELLGSGGVFQVA